MDTSEISLPNDKVIVENFYKGHLLLLEKKKEKMQEVIKSFTSFGIVDGEEIRECAVYGVKAFYSNLQKKLAEKYLVGKEINIFSSGVLRSYRVRVTGIKLSSKDSVLFMIRHRRDFSVIEISTEDEVVFIVDQKR